MEKRVEQLIFMDGWHPTINPSSRMPIHHHRFVDLLCINKGILNELPRPYGGSTLRAMQIDNDGNMNISRLNRTIKYMPWWISASSDRAIRIMNVIIDVAISHRKSIATASYKKLQEAYMFFAAGNPSLTFGECLNISNTYLYKTVYPELPDVTLESLVHLPVLKEMCDGLQSISFILNEIFSTVGNMMCKKEFGLLGILTEHEGDEWRLIYTTEDKRFSIETLSSPHNRKSIEISDIVELLQKGKFLPGSQLLVLIELSLTQLGYQVTHYGNAYNKHEVFSNALGIDNKVEYWPDDTDSWNFVMLQGINGEQYPLHLLDILCCDYKVLESIGKIIKRSLYEKKTIIKKLKKGGTLLDALSD